MKIKITGTRNALRAVERYVDSIPGRLNKVIQTLVDEGVNIARIKVIDLGAWETFELAESIDGLVYTEGNKGIIFTNCPYAAYVEIGTGVVGEGSPHPTHPWAYDVNNHGQAGWWYPTDATDPNPTKKPYKDGYIAWTKGMPSRPFMQMTSVELRDKLGEIVKEAFK